MLDTPPPSTIASGSSTLMIEASARARRSSYRRRAASASASPSSARRAISAPLSAREVARQAVSSHIGGVAVRELPEGIANAAVLQQVAKQGAPGVLLVWLTERETPLRLAVKPGLTGLAQVHNGYDTSVASVTQKVRLDLEYIRDWSLWADFKILFKTVVVVLTGRGAY